jgi:phosphoribosyl 1,2-cyclic phosphate phosphodiesterase
MQIEILGSGGAITIPRPGCSCRLCREAREKGPPYARSGPAVFVHGPNALVDTPEEIKDQLNRADIDRVPACFYSHWHPDHLMGRRLWEMNIDWRHWPPEGKHTDIYLPERVARDFRQYLGSWDHLEFFQDKGIVALHVVANGETVNLGDYRITPFPLAEAFVYAFIIEGDGKRALIAPDELLGWKPDRLLGHFDLALVPMGVVDVNPLTGAQNIPAEHPVLALEATFRQTLDILRSVDADRLIMTHIEEPDGMSYDDLLQLEQKLAKDGWSIRFAYDGMMLHV